jgi:hypothetical protein
MERRLTRISGMRRLPSGSRSLRLLARTVSVRAGAA